MDHIRKALLISLVFVFHPSFAQWAVQPYNASNAYQNVVFTDSLHGYIAAYGLLSTTDGGATWKQTTTDDNALLKSVSVKKGCLWASSEDGKVYGSTDSGKTLIEQFTAKTPYDFHTICFVDSLRGWLFGFSWGMPPAGDIILHTTDGGLTWNTQYELDQSFVSGVDLFQGFFVDSLHGWATQGDHMLHTFNGGNDWIHQSVPGSPNLYSVFFIDTSRGWAVGDDESDNLSHGPESYVIFTTDGGQNWVKGNSPVPAIVHSVFFVDSSRGWMCCVNGNIERSTDGGRNWAVQQSNTTSILESVFFLNATDGWAVGEFTVILHTTNGGGLTYVPPTNEMPVTFSMSQNFPNPFNPATKIRYTIPVPGDVNLSVYDLLGNRISVLQNGPKAQGEWEKVFDARGLPSGMYICRITYSHGGSIQVGNHKMLLLK